MARQTLREKETEAYDMHSTEVDRTSATTLASARLAPLARDKHMSLLGDH